MTKVIHHGNEVDITYRNDVVFKKTLGEDDEDSKKVLKFLLYAITKKTFHNITVVNSEMLGKFVFNKKNYLDLRATDDEGNFYQIEMQQKNLDEFQMKRIQQYGYRAITNYLESGEKYDKIKNVYQIILTTGRFNGKLLSEYKQREDNGHNMPHNLVTFYVISLPYIEDIITERQELSDLELMSYVYQKEVDSDIMKLANQRQKEVLKIMNKKLNDLLSKYDVLDEAIQDALYEQEQQGQKEYARNEGIQQGLQQGIKQGVQQGLQQGMYQNLKENVHKLIKRFYHEDANWLDSCNMEQLEKAFDLVFNQLPYQQFKEEILKNK